jgi:hypothetical protein
MPHVFRKSATKLMLLALVVTAACAIALREADAAHGTTSATHATSSIVVGRYRVVVEGFRVSSQTWDNALQSDGKGDEVFLDTKLAYVDSNGKDLAPQSDFRSATMGDTNNQNGRVQAGSASDRGGLISGDTFPNPLNIGADAPAGSSSTFTPPLTLWEGDLIKGERAVVITPSLWEWDGSGDVFGGWLTWANTAFTKIAKSVGTFIGGGSAADTIKNATQLGLDVLNVFGDPDFRGIPGDRPIGTTRNSSGPGFIFDPKVVLLNYDRAEALISQKTNGVSGAFALQFTDDPTLTGDYTLWFRVERVTQTSDVTAPRVTIQPATLKPKRAVLHWAAEDPYVEGAATTGVDSYDLSMRKGTNPWHRVLSNTESTTYTIAGKHSAHFSYRVRARDGKGNTSNWTPTRGVVLP